MQKCCQTAEDCVWMYSTIFLVDWEGGKFVTWWVEEDVKTPEYVVRNGNCHLYNLYWCTVPLRKLKGNWNSSDEISACWLRHQHSALPRVRTGLLMLLGGLTPCTLTALMTNWYSVSGINPFNTMEFVSMGSRMYVHSVSISGLRGTGHRETWLRICLPTITTLFKGTICVSLSRLVTPRCT